MAYFLVRLEHGPDWDDARPRREQRGWVEHAACMDRLAADGVIVLGGPMGDDVDSGPALMLVRADTAEAAARAFDSDPWHDGVLSTGSVDRWELWLGESAQP